MVLLLVSIILTSSEPPHEIAVEVRGGDPSEFKNCCLRSFYHFWSSAVLRQLLSLIYTSKCLHAGVVAMRLALIVNSPCVQKETPQLSSATTGIAPAVELTSPSSPFTIDP